MLSGREDHRLNPGLQVCMMYYLPLTGLILMLFTVSLKHQVRASMVDYPSGF
jgi:hypothetical protein